MQYSLLAHSSKHLTIPLICIFILSACGSGGDTDEISSAQKINDIYIVDITRETDDSIGTDIRHNPEEIQKQTQDDVQIESNGPAVRNMTDDEILNFQKNFE